MIFNQIVFSPIILSLLLLLPSRSFAENSDSTKLSSQHRKLLHHYQAALKAQDKAKLLSLYHSRAFDCITEKNKRFNNKEKSLSEHFFLSNFTLDDSRSVPFKDIQSYLNTLLSQTIASLPEVHTKDISFSVTPSEQLVLYWKASQPEEEPKQEQSRLLLTKEGNRLTLTFMCVSERFYNYQSTLESYLEKTKRSLQMYENLSLETRRKLVRDLPTEKARAGEILKKRISKELHVEDDFILDLLATRLQGEKATMHQPPIN